MFLFFCSRPCLCCLQTRPSAAGFPWVAAATAYTAQLRRSAWGRTSTEKIKEAKAWQLAKQQPTTANLVTLGFVLRLKPADWLVSSKGLVLQSRQEGGRTWVAISTVVMPSLLCNIGSRNVAASSCKPPRHLFDASVTLRPWPTNISNCTCPSRLPN
eukprot:354292-Chlamydomonas_euryale.AAC.4